MPSGVEASWWILLFVYKCLQRSVLGRGGSSTNQQSLTALHSPKCVCEPFGRSCVFIGCAGSQPIMFIAALGEVCCWMRSCQLSWHRWLMRALFEIFDVTIIMMALIVVKCVLRGRPQGGRAVFIHWLDCAWNKDSNGCLIVLLLSLFLEIWIRIWNVDCWCGWGKSGL